MLKLTQGIRESGNLRLTHENVSINLYGSTSAQWQNFLKTYYGRTKANCVYRNYGIVGDNLYSNWNMFWQIKDPTLRAIRLKIAWRDVMSNERRERFKMTSDPRCICCGSVETVNHQLWECNNAQRIWNFTFKYLKTNSLFTNNITDIIIYNSNYCVEFVKSITFKYLIQIDRSRNLTYELFKTACDEKLSLELKTLTNERKLALANTIEILLSS